VKYRFPFASYGDIWTLAAVVGVQKAGGPGMLLLLMLLLSMMTSDDGE
jgi:hypothetical protein